MRTEAQKKAERKGIVIVRDSLLVGLEKNNELILSHPGALSLDISDYISCDLRRSLHYRIILASTNDIITGEDTIMNIAQIVNEARKTAPLTNIVVPELLRQHYSLQRK